ncbi:MULTISPECIES: single-stranded DNA-binding protein [Prochlorococcus]|uniref:Single-stranded DNA-binding protein n=1 Tax=Prochlorococcus marinus str. MIT 9116 TaxID=167544 RepID=A0A0A1ZPX2_PROMR|nr:single-stranded DNA-binding protein [Prochlorococcus marinus]KGF91031.1 Single-stranded DNA-binding protein [Prochlorococcus marinus str. MIT 9107]KGF91490.1 Single-stranded DNA-binding protein [Prochlorococcus marinus str. MIT 9116]KGF93272.1 Single-stranded DNA-binding protein [Prochlorococcus marinus str. MIT 9123]
MNHCLIQAVINSAPQMRYTKENQVPIAEMIVNFKGLRIEDPTRELKIVGWGNIAQEMIDELKEGQNIVIEGRLRMNSVTRKDGTKEKQPELTASKIHQITPIEVIKTDQKENSESFNKKENTKNSNWDSSPLVPEVDEIPF